MLPFHPSSLFFLITHFVHRLSSHFPFTKNTSKKNKAWARPLHLSDWGEGLGEGLTLRQGERKTGKMWGGKWCRWRTRTHVAKLFLARTASKGQNERKREWKSRALSRASVCMVSVCYLFTVFSMSHFSVWVNILHIIHLHVLLVLHRQQQVGIRRSWAELVTRQDEEGQSGKFI